MSPSVAQPKFPVVIINTGGTLNKRYNPITGALIVPADERAITHLLQSALPNLDLHLIGLIHKDSLEITEEDRRLLAAAIHALPSNLNNAPIVIVHGTDTLHLTAEFLNGGALNRVVILTGAMRPVEIEPIEAAVHLGLALGFAAARPLPGVYVAMHGRILPYQQLVKNRDIGVFQAV
ncbi:MAG: asparaginase domain-containing protein [Halothiobacillus sp.]